MFFVFIVNAHLCPPVIVPVVLKNTHETEQDTSVVWVLKSPTLSENAMSNHGLCSLIYSVALGCLTGQINSLCPMLTNADFIFSFFVIRDLNVQLFLFLFLSLSDCSWCWALSSTAMIPPSIAACMRNEKLGEACFYLMGHNQTTVCSSINTRCFCAVA